MDFRKNMLCAMMGGMIIYTYMKCKDGTIKRTIKNMKPMMENAINELEKKL